MTRRQPMKLLSWSIGHRPRRLFLEGHPCLSLFNPSTFFSLSSFSRYSRSLSLSARVFFAGTRARGRMTAEPIRTTPIGFARRRSDRRPPMGTMLTDDVPAERLDQLIAQANPRLAWRRRRFSDFLHGYLTLAQHIQLQAKCLRVFGPRWREAIAKEEPWHINRP